MDSIESAIIDQLKQASSTADYVDLMVASQIVGSTSLRQRALDGLVSSDPKPSLAQARLIGLDATYTVMQAANAALVQSGTTKQCSRCPRSCVLYCPVHGSST